MSPEQLAGDKLDGRSDVYSLALVAFNMLTGKLPFEGETAQESMIMRLTDEPKSLAVMKPDTSWAPEVQAVMYKALQRKAADRYQKASDFGVALWQAVERMPKQAAAGATQMIGAMDGATAMISAPPKTRLDASAAAPAAAVEAPMAAATGSVPARSKTPVYAGAGLAAVALAVLATIYLPKSADKSGATPLAADSLKIATPVTAAPANMPQNPPAAAGTTGQPVNQRPAVARPTGNPSVGSPPASSAIDVVATRLPILLEESTVEGKYTQALQEARSLMSKASEEQRVGLTLVQARALGMQNDTNRACPLLRNISTRAKNTAYDDQVTHLLVSSC